MKRLLFRSLFGLIILLPVLIITHSYAWLYPEHRDITALAIYNLEPRYRLILDQLWDEARIGYEHRLSESVVDSTPGYIDYASWPAIAGDHSCSSENMLHNILDTDWILEVDKIASSLKNDLVAADNKSEHANAVRDSDLRFQKADPEYAARAATNIVHFLLARPNVDTDARTYGKVSLSEGSRLNAIGAYAWFHLSALEKASLLNNSYLTQEQRSQIVLSTLADEAFALHFLQDVFAAGHVAGTWGDASQRKGTHDYYNENGLEVFTWDGRRMILMGDAYLRSQDAEVAAETIRQSIEQVIDVSTGKTEVDNKQADFWQPDTFNVCQSKYWPKKEFDRSLSPLLAGVLMTTPAPGLATGKGSLPRFRTELGTFIGVVPAVRVSGFNKDFVAINDEPFAIGAIEMALRFGVGLEGVLNQSGDGLVFLDVGTRLDGNSTSNTKTMPDLTRSGAPTAAIPSRAAYFLRARIPFWLIPGDLLFTAPILLLISPDTYAQMAVQAANGGLIPWQAGIATPIGRFQFIVGREVGITFYGHNRNKDYLVIPGNNNELALIQYRSMQFDFPLIEYRPFRLFSTNQSSSVVAQLSAGFEYPHSQKLIVPAESDSPELSTIWYMGIRIAFDWRYYW